MIADQNDLMQRNYAYATMVLRGEAQKVEVSTFTDQPFATHSKLIGFYRAIGFFLMEAAHSFKDVHSESIEDYGVTLIDEADCMTLASEEIKDTMDYHFGENKHEALSLMKQQEGHLHLFTQPNT